MRRPDPVTRPCLTSVGFPGAPRRGSSARPGGTGLLAWLEFGTEQCLDQAVHRDVPGRPSSPGRTGRARGWPWPTRWGPRSARPPGPARLRAELEHVTRDRLGAEERTAPQQLVRLRRADGPCATESARRPSSRSGTPATFPAHDLRTARRAAGGTRRPAMPPSASIAPACSSASGRSPACPPACQRPRSVRPLAGALEQELRALGALEHVQRDRVDHGAPSGDCGR